MSFIDEMANLRISIDETKERTAAAVRQVTKDTKKIRGGAQALVREFAATQKATAGRLQEDLKRATNELKTGVKRMREDNIREQKERQRELTEARAAFWRGKAATKKGGKS